MKKENKQALIFILIAAIVPKQLDLEKKGKMRREEKEQSTC